MQNTISEAQRVQTDNNAKPGEILPQSLNSDISMMKQSYFKNIQITPINGSANINVFASQNTTQFEIPISCYNPYWSVISFTVTCPNNSVAGSFQKIPNNFWPWFNRVELYTASGNVYLTNSQQCDIYSCLAAPICNDIEDGDSCYNVCGSSQRTYAGNTFAAAAGNAILSNTTIATPQIPQFDPLTYYRITGANTSVNVSCIPKNKNCHSNGIYSYKTTADADGAIQAFTYSIPLRKILPDSFFNVNNSFWLSKVLYLRITWNESSRILSYFSRPVDNTPYTNPYLHTETGSVAAIPITNINLQLNVEGDESCINAKKMLSESPSTIVIPYVYNWNQSQSGVGTLQTSYTLASDGSRVYKLYKMYSGLCNTTVSAYPVFSNYEESASLVDGVQAFNRVFLYINGIMIKSFDLNPASLNMMFSEIKNNFPHCSLNNIQEALVYGGIPYNFTTEPVKHGCDEYSNMIAKGLDAAKSNLAVNIQYQWTNANSHTVQLYLFPVVFKSFEYVAGTFNYQ